MSKPATVQPARVDMAPLVLVGPLRFVDATSLWTRATAGRILTRNERGSVGMMTCRDPAAGNEAAEPPLRERREDVLPLAKTLLAEAATRLRRPIDGLSPDAAACVLAAAWPGNVRELENAMERAAAVARGPRVELDDLPADLRVAPRTTLPTAGSVRHLEDVEREYILAALSVNGGNQTRTAEQLHIGSATLYRKLKRYRAQKPG